MSEVTCHKCRRAPSKEARSIPNYQSATGVEFCNWNHTRLILGYYLGYSQWTSHPDCPIKLETQVLRLSFLVSKSLTRTLPELLRTSVRILMKVLEVHIVVHRWCFRYYPRPHWQASGCSTVATFFSFPSQITWITATRGDYGLGKQISLSLRK